MRKPVILISVETANRELFSKIYLSKKLIDAGFKVIIGESSDVFKSADLIAPDIFLTQSMSGHKKRIKLYKDLMEKHGTVIIALDQEGGHFQSLKKFVDRRIGPMSAVYFRHFFAWGNRAKRAINNYSNFPGKRVLVTGEPKYDLKNPESHYFNLAGQIRQEQGSFILVNTNFGLYNHFDKTIKAAIEAGAPGVPPSTDAYQRESQQRQVLSAMVALVKDLSSKLEKEKIVIRPHPSEDFSFYEKEFCRIDGVSIIHRGDVIPWVLAAETVIHNDCSTAIEAFIFGRQPIEFCPLGVQRDKGLPSRLSFQAENLEEVVRQLEHVKRGDRVALSDESLSMLHDSYGPLDGHAADRIVSALRKTLDTRVSKPRLASVLMRNAGCLKVEHICILLFGTDGYRRLRRTNLFGRKRKEQFLYREQKFPELGKNKLFSKFISIIPSCHNSYRIKKFRYALDLYSIEAR